MPPSAAVQLESVGGATRLRLSGRLDAAGVGALWAPVMRAAGKSPLHADLTAVTDCDTAGVAMLLAAEAAHGKPIEWVGASSQVTALLDRLRALPPAAQQPKAKAGSLRDIGVAATASLRDAIAFLGEGLLALLRLPARLRMMRMRDLLGLIDLAGVQAIPLVLLMGFLIGLILAFQSAIPLRAYGADLLVAYLVSISLVRELGPLLAAVILAGRTGSAYAAEIGTMKVNQELDALSTMGLDIMTMQVLPRMFAAMLVMPVLTMALVMAGLVGMASVMVMLGFTPAAVLNQIQQSVKLPDLFGGLFKATCFGAAIAAIGCRAGLATGSGPRAVGIAATSAVVGGIVATVVLDGGFALLFYRLRL